MGLNDPCCRIDCAVDGIAEYVVVSGVLGWRSGVARFDATERRVRWPQRFTACIRVEESTFRSSLSMTKSNALCTQVEKASRQDNVAIVECKIKSAEGADDLAASTWPRCASGPLLSEDCC